MNIKSLLLGSAAALAVVSGAQAADAIVAAEPEPMEYVRVCDAFGTGYFYIPGTETCLKVSGYMRYDIGIGNRGNEIIKELNKTGLCNIVALCDVDMGAKQTLEVMNMFPQAKKYQDFRKMFDEIGSEFDAVSIATPDFSHFPATMMALAEGKHVYVEKPFTSTVAEAEELTAIAKAKGLTSYDFNIVNSWWMQRARERASQGDTSLYQKLG